MSKTAKILTLIGLAAGVAAIVIVKMIWFPAVREEWFQTNNQLLRRVPSGQIVLRPTHFPGSRTNEIGYTVMKKRPRWAGRNVTFQELIALAYQYNPGKIYLPVDAPTHNFDFVLTTADPQKSLKNAILKMGFSAGKEMKDVDVLALKVNDPELRELAPSGTAERPNANLRSGRLYLTHIKVAEIVEGLSGVLEKPVVDKTGLTNFYDMSFTWTRGRNPQQLDRSDIDKIVADMGLRLEPDTASMEMLVVKKQF